MSLDASEMEWAVRLSAQLKSLSEVTESLTYRILELEERFAGQDHPWLVRRRTIEERQSSLLDRMQGCLHDTDVRLGRFEVQPRLDEPPAVSPRRLANPSRRALCTPPALTQADSLRLCQPSEDVSSEMERAGDDVVFEDGVEPSLAS